MERVLAGGLLALRFLAAVVVSGFQTVVVIVRTGIARRGPPPAALIRMRFAPMSPRGATLLACMVSLTPGTTTIDVDMDRHELLLHVLDASDAAATVRSIRRGFEPGLVTIFGKSAR